MKKCPFCAEEIQDDAVKCKHCGEFIIDAELKRFRKGGDVKWYYRTSMVIISLLCFGPLALPLVWFNPRYSTVTKTVVTIAVVVFTAALCYSTIEIYAELLKELGKMGM